MKHAVLTKGRGRLSPIIMHSAPTSAMDSADAVLSGGTRGRDLGLSSMDNHGVNSHPHTIDDYNRVMLQYTQRQMAAFTNNNDMSEGRNRGMSRSSGQSNNSSVTNMAQDGSGPSPPRFGDRTPPDTGRA
jgi:hypothetical protein